MVGDVFPRSAPRSSVSHAEVAVWRALHRGLPRGWRAWHSLRLRCGNHWEGEGDFVIAAPERGLLVLEVKGGRVELRDGRWFQNGRGLDRAPRQQGLDFAKKLVGELRARGLETPAYGVACAFPDVDFSADRGPQAGDLADLVIGPRQLEWLEHALPTLFARAVPDHPPPRNRKWLTALHELWGETWVPQLSLSDEAKDGETRVVQLVQSQLQLLAAAEDNPRAVITGGAGTGKTLLSRELCLRAAARGQRVLYLCFTDALGRVVERSFEPARRTGARARAMPVRRFAAMLLSASGAPIAPDDPRFWQTASLQAACDAMPPEGDRPELVVVDEAQDLEPGDWDLVGELVGPRPLWILADDRQAFWRRPPIPEALTAGAIRLKLHAQHRSPSAIAALAARYPALATATSSDITRPGVPSDPTAIRLAETTAGAEIDRVTAELVELLRRGARPGDIAILTLAGVSASQLLRRDTLGGQRIVRADDPDAAHHVVADTFLRFKGLERPFVLLVELAAGHASEYDRRMHIAITRAMSRLVIVATADDLERDPRLAKIRDR